MSDNFRKVFGPKTPFDDDEDGSYRAWITCKAGDVLDFELVPPRASGEPERGVSYFQLIETEYHPESGQLALLCYGTGARVFLQGRGLKALKQELSKRRVRSIHVFDPEIYPQPRNDDPVVTDLVFERPD